MGMERINTAYASFGAYVCERRDWRSEDKGFLDFCKEHGADPAVLDAILVEELGMTGEEVLEALRTENDGHD